MTKNSPTRDEAVRSLIERYDAAMACQKESPDASLIVMANYGDLAINHLRAMLATAPAPASGGVEAVAEAYAEGQKDAQRDHAWMHDKAWQDAVLMLVYYTDLDKRVALVTRAEVESKRASAWEYCLSLSRTRTAEDIDSLSPAATPVSEAEPVACPHCGGTGKWTMPGGAHQLDTIEACNHCDGALAKPAAGDGDA